MDSETRHLVSIGNLCQQFQRPYFDVLQTLNDAGVKPAMTLDLAPYYDFDQSFRMLEADPPMIRG